MTANAANQWRKRSRSQARPQRPDWAQSRWWVTPPHQPVTALVDLGGMGQPVAVAVYYGDTNGGCWHAARDSRDVIREARSCVLDLTGKPARSVRVVRR